MSDDGHVLRLNSGESVFHSSFQLRQRNQRKATRWQRTGRRYDTQTSTTALRERLLTTDDEVTSEHRSADILDVNQISRNRTSSTTIWTIALSGVFVLLWSSGWVGAKFGLGYSGPFTFLSIRYFLVVIALSLFIAFLSTVKPLARISLPELFDHALVGLLSHGIYLAGSVGAMTFGASAGMVAFLSAMQPLFTTLCAGWILHEGTERASHLQWLGIALGILAVYVTLASDIQGGGSGIAYLLLFISVCSISIATLVDRRVTVRRKKLGLAPSQLIQILWVHSTSALLFFGILGWFLEGFEATWSREYMLTLAYMAIVVSIASYGLLYFLLRHMSAVNVSSLIYLTPPATMLLAWPILGESISLGGLIGLGIGGIAVVVVMATGNNRKKVVV